MEISVTKPFKTGRKCSLSRLCVQIVTTAAVCLAGGFIGGAAYYLTRSGETATASQSVLGHYRAIRSVLQSTVFRIDPGSPCTHSSCVMCKTKIPLQQNHGQPYTCEHSSEVQNGSCFLCNNECKNFTFMQTAIQSPNKTKCGGQSVDICCPLAQMGNLLEYPAERCGARGQYRCYAEQMNNGKFNKTVACLCEPGFHGPNCESIYEETVRCHCHAGGYTFCGQENMMHCNDTSKSRTTCQIYINDLNCVCNRTGAFNTDVDDDITDTDASAYSNVCELPSERTTGSKQSGLTSGASDLYISGLVIFIVMPTIIVSKWD